jgi:hypothetical protein
MTGSAYEHCFGSNKAPLPQFIRQQTVPYRKVLQLWPGLWPTSTARHIVWSRLKLYTSLADSSEANLSADIVIDILPAFHLVSCIRCLLGRSILKC